MIILVANLKGGVRRTTLSLRLAIAAARQGSPTAIADTTMSGDTSRHFSHPSRAADNDVSFEIMEFPISSDYFDKDQKDRDIESQYLAQKIASVEASLGKDGLVFIDSPSHAPDLLRTLSQVADHTIVPFDFSTVSLDPTLDTLDCVQSNSTVAAYQTTNALSKDDRDCLEDVLSKATNSTAVLLPLPVNDWDPDIYDHEMPYRVLLETVLENLGD